MKNIGFKIIFILVIIFSLLISYFCSSSKEDESKNQSSTQNNSNPPTEVFLEESCCSDDSYCQDGLWCNGRELCNCWGECLPGSPPDCDDGDECTQDICNETLDRCEHNQIPDCCHTSADCDDSNPCTNDVCNNGNCRHTALTNGTPCGTSTDPCYRGVCQNGSCSLIVNPGAECIPNDPNPCFRPGVCRNDGICQPVLHPPSNDTCASPEVIALSPSGVGSASGSTECARDGDGTVSYSSWCGGTNNPDVVYRLNYTVSNTEYQLYSYNIIVNADYNSVLYARTTCSNPATEVVCNNDCVSNPILNCSSYALDPTDSGITLGPKPAGTSQTFYLFVDGIGGSGGPFMIGVYRVAHSNNPCSSWRDNVRVVDATRGGTYLGNVDGYVNDLMDFSLNWVKTPCHDVLQNASFDWPARAWFKLAPSVATNYRIETNETVPPDGFDNVIEVWDNSFIKGCDGIKDYIACSYQAGTKKTRLDITVPAGSTYLVGISNYTRPVGGDYMIKFTIR